MQPRTSTSTRYARPGRSQLKAQLRERAEKAEGLVTYWLDRASRSEAALSEALNEIKFLDEHLRGRHHCDIAGRKLVPEPIL